MKPILAGRPVLTALLAFCVTGCASSLRSMSGHMAPEGAAKYASMSPEEFVKTRFYTEELNFLDHLSLKLGPDNPDKRPIRPFLSADGRMVSAVAHYNDVNYHQLTRPQQNLQLYCEAARRGKWQLVQGYEKDPIAAAQSNLAVVYTEAEFQTLEQLRRQNGDSGYAPAEAEIAATTAAIATRRAAALNAQIASAYGGGGFQKAIVEGAFGVFRCDEATNSWSVSVLPQAFYPGNPSNQLETPTAVLAIRPFKAEEQRQQAVDGK